MQEMANDPGNTALARELEESQQVIANLLYQTSVVQTLGNDVERQWSNPDKRIIGHVVWAPKIDVGVGVPPYSFTRDFSVIHLDKEKFKNGFLGNTLSLGMLC